MEAVVKTYATMLAMCSYLFTSAISQAMQILLGRSARRQTPSGSRRTRGLGDRGLLRGVHHHFRRHRAVREHHFRPADRQCRRHSPLPHRHSSSILRWKSAAPSTSSWCALCRPAATSFFPPRWPSFSAGTVAVCVIMASRAVFWGSASSAYGVAMSADELCRAGIFIVRFRRGNWKNLSLVDEKKLTGFSRPGVSHENIA